MTPEDGRIIGLLVGTIAVEGDISCPEGDVFCSITSIDRPNQPEHFMIETSSSVSSEF